MTKKCTKCGTEKPLDCFSKRADNPEKLASWCKACVADNARKYDTENPEQHRNRTSRWQKKNGPMQAKKAREWYHDNKKRANENRKNHRHNNPEKHRDAVLKRTYGISLKDYQTLLEAQNGKCAICKKETTSNCGRNLSVDHCHETGRVRGLLCGKCNGLLGFAKDRPDILAQALEYLKA